MVWHALNSLLLFWLLFAMTNARWRSALCAALFAFHPLHVESVAWIAERKDVLSTFFFLLTVFSWHHAVTVRKRMWFFLSLVFYAIGLMAKPMLVSLPCVLLLLDFWPLKRIDRFRDLFTRRHGLLLLEKIPFAVLAVASAAMTVYAQRTAGAVMPVAAFSFVNRIETALWSYVMYLYKMVWPVDLTALYPLQTGLHPFRMALGATLFIGVTAMAVWVGRRYRFLLTGWLWYVITLVPVIGLVQVGNQSMADRYTYIPLLGIFIMLSFGVAAAVSHRIAKAATIAGSLAVLITLLPLTKKQVSIWENSMVFFKYVLSVNESNYIMHSNYGVTLRNYGKTEESFKEFKRALELCPVFGDANFHLGLYYFNAGKSDTALLFFQRAIALKPAYGLYHGYLGRCLQCRGDIAGAIRELRIAVRLQKDWPEAQNSLAWILATSSDTTVRNPSEAQDLAQQVCKITLNSIPEFLDTYAVACAAAGDFARAMGLEQKAILLAEKNGSSQLIDVLKSHLTLFSSGRIYLEERPDSTVFP